jgi:hypothetical protein
MFRMSLRAGLRGRLGVVAVLALSCALHLGCASEPKASEVLQVVDPVTGWFDAGIVGGENKLVPMLSFSVKNAGNKGSVSYVSFNTVFKVINDPEELGSALLKGIDGKGLAPGQTAGPYVARSNLGYTSPVPRMEIFQHSQFKDAQVELFAKHRSGGWVKIAQYKVQRQLLTH